nr:hypothetical protein [Sphingomonas sp.]
MADLLMMALLVLSALPAVFSYLGKTRNMYVTGLLFLVALGALASVQNPGRNMAVFVPMAIAWFLLAAVLAGNTGTVGHVRRQIRENS